MLIFLLTGSQLIFCKEVFGSHLFNMECCTLALHGRGSLESFIYFYLFIFNLFHVDNKIESIEYKNVYISVSIKTIAKHKNEC